MSVNLYMYGVLSRARGHIWSTGVKMIPHDIKVTGTEISASGSVKIE